MRSSTLAVLTPVLLLGIAARAQQYPPATDSARASAGSPIAKSVATDSAVVDAQRAAEALVRARRPGAVCRELGQ
ncbi:MAG: hypothetical protein ACR2M1_10245 [Gemmatimonadaceae bacterium]